MDESDKKVAVKQIKLPLRGDKNEYVLVVEAPSKINFAVGRLDVTVSTDRKNYYLTVDVKLLDKDWWPMESGQVVIPLAGLGIDQIKNPIHPRND